MNIDRTSMQERLAALQAEHRKGQQQLTLLQERQEETRQTVLRIEGAIQVLQELLQPDPAAQPASAKAPMAAVK